MDSYHQDTATKNDSIEILEEISKKLQQINDSYFDMQGKNELVAVRHSAVCFKALHGVYKNLSS